MDRGAWWATVHRAAKRWTRLKQLSMHDHIKYITNKDLLYSTGNSTQYSAMTYMGKESQKEWVYVYVGFPGGTSGKEPPC